MTMPAPDDIRAGEGPPSASNREAVEGVRSLARRVRVQILRMTSSGKTSHVASGLSIADILAVLYGAVMHVSPEDPGLPGRDRLVLSKGHAAAALYAVLAESGFFPVEELKRYCQDGSVFWGHATSSVPGVEVSTGSLGHGLGIAAGMALSAKLDGSGFRVFAVLSDGECDEGSIWEAALFAAHHRLGNLLAVVDYNKLQSLGLVEETLALEPFAGKWRAFGWRVREVDGHDHAELIDAMVEGERSDRPTCLLAHTVKGKGVSFMEHLVLWHYRSPSQEDVERALLTLGDST